MKSFFELKVTMKYVNCDFIRVPRNKKDLDNQGNFHPGDPRVFAYLILYKIGSRSWTFQKRAFFSLSII